MEFLLATHRLRPERPDNAAPSKRAQKIYPLAPIAPKNLTPRAACVPAAKRHAMRARKRQCSFIERQRERHHQASATHDLWPLCSERIAVLKRDDIRR